MGRSTSFSPSSLGVKALGVINLGFLDRFTDCVYRKQTAASGEFDGIVLVGVTQEGVGLAVGIIEKSSGRPFHRFSEIKSLEVQDS